MSERAAALLEPMLRRALVVQTNGGIAANAQRTASFIQAAHGLARAHLDASDRLEALRQRPAGGPGAARLAVGRLVASIRQLERSLRAAEPVLGRRLPGVLAAEPVDLQLPVDGVILSGRPFFTSLRVSNPGDNATERATAELTVGPGLRLLGGSSRPVPSIKAQGQVTLRWRLQATQPGAHLASPVQFTFRRGDATVYAVDRLIAALKP